MEKKGSFSIPAEPRFGLFLSLNYEPAEPGLGQILSPNLNSEQGFGPALSPNSEPELRVKTQSWTKLQKVGEQQ